MYFYNLLGICMRELTLKELDLISGAAAQVPVMVGGAVIGAVGYAGAVIGGQEFSWAELGLAVTGELLLQWLAVQKLLLWSQKNYFIL